MKYVDLETGEIRTLIPYRHEQARLVRQTRLVWGQKKRKAKRQAWGKYFLKVLMDNAVVVVLAIVALSIMCHGSVSALYEAIK